MQEVTEVTRTCKPRDSCSQARIAGLTFSSVYKRNPFTRNDQSCLDLRPPVTYNYNQVLGDGDDDTETPKVRGACSVLK